MATLEEIKSVARKVYPSTLHKGCLDLSPPVRLVLIPNGLIVGAWLLDSTRQMVRLVGEDGFFPVDRFIIMAEQGRMKSREMPDELWKELEDLLNLVANERTEDVEDLGSVPTYNAKRARDMLDKLWMERRKPAHLI